MMPPNGPRGPQWNVFPIGSNPVQASIPTFLWTEAVIRGPELGPEHGVRGVPKLDNAVKLVYAVASNAVINQHADINRTAKILQDERLVEFLVVQDNFLTPTARFADIVLPACTQLDDLRRRFGPIDRIYPLEDPAAAAGREPEVANWEEL
jgi:anaerobic dimethyl sulfoxide reductase subunit A